MLILILLFNDKLNIGQTYDNELVISVLKSNIVFFKCCYCRMHGDNNIFIRIISEFRAGNLCTWICHDQKRIVACNCYSHPFKGLYMHVLLYCITRKKLDSLLVRQIGFFYTKHYTSPLSGKLHSVTQHIQGSL